MIYILVWLSKDVHWAFFQSCFPTSLPNLQEITMFYYLPQGGPLYQKIDTLFRRITWRHAVHCQLQGPVTDFGLRCISSSWHALPYKWLPRRQLRDHGVPEQVVSQPPPASVPRVFPLSPHLTSTPGVNPEIWVNLQLLLRRCFMWCQHQDDAKHC